MARSNTAGVSAPTRRPSLLEEQFGGVQNVERLNFTESPIEISGDFTAPSTPFSGISQATADRLKLAPEGSLERGDIPSPPMTEPTIRDTVIGLDNRRIQRENTQIAAVAGANFLTSVINTQTRYNAISNQAKFNIYQAERSIYETRQIGAQRVLEARQAGDAAADDAVLAMIAQGQDAQGPATQRVASSVEAYGIYNSMIEEINTQREIMGFEQEINMLEGQMDSALLQRNIGFLNAGIELGASLLPLA